MRKNPIFPSELSHLFRQNHHLKASPVQEQRVRQQLAQQVQAAQAQAAQAAQAAAQQA